MAPQGTVALRDAIEALREELAWAEYRGRGQHLRFRPGPIELTVQVTLTQQSEGRAGIRWWVLDAGGTASAGNATVQTVKLTLEPIVIAPDGSHVSEQLIDDDAASVGMSADLLDDAE